MSLPSIETIVRQYAEGAGASALATALRDREDNMADLLRLAGAQFGLYPEIVAKVLTDIGLGTQPTEEGRLLINQQFVARMEWIRQQHQQGND